MEVSDNQTDVVNTVINDAVADSSVQSAPESPELGGADASEAPEWKPNFKVKAYDKEFEIPEKFREFINKDNERDFRDTFEKAYALEVMKEKNARIRESNEQYQNKIEKEFAPKLQRYEKIEKFIKNKDFDSFLEQAQVSESDLQSWMLRRLQLKELPPDQQALYNDHRAAQLRAYQLEEENLSFKEKEEKVAQEQQQKIVNEQLDLLDKVCQSDEVESIAKDFDQRLGQDGSFKLEVLRRASLIAQTTGKELTVQEAVNDFLKVLGQQSSKPQAGNESEVTEAVPAPKPKPTLPSLNGKATSPAQQKIKSLDDLKKLSKQVIASASKASRE